jgi:hypothetical protein
VTGKAVSADFTCNPDFDTYQLGVITRWTPVKNLTFLGGSHVVPPRPEDDGAATLTPAAPKPTATYEYRDQHAVSLLVRAQRNF